MLPQALQVRRSTYCLNGCEDGDDVMSYFIVSRLEEACSRDTRGSHPADR